MLHEAAAAPQVRHHPLGPLLDEAEARLRRRPDYARPLAGGTARARGIAAALREARACVAAMARPRSAVLALGSAHLSAMQPLPVPAGRPALVTACLMTLGHGQPAAFDWLGRDYLAHHVQTELSREALFALGRRLRDAGSGGAPAGWATRRLALMAGDGDGGRRRWDAGAVQGLLAAFRGADLGVQAIESGCFEPLHTLLSLTLATAPAIAPS